MKKPIFILLALAVCSGLILLTLDKLMGGQKLSLNGFERKFSKASVNKIRNYALEKTATSIAGWSGKNLYMSTVVPGEVIILDMDNGTQQFESIKLPEINKLSSAFHTTVNYPEIFIAGANARKLIRGNLKTGKTEVFDVNCGPLLNAIITDRDNAIIRYVDTNSLELYFKPLNFVTGAQGNAVRVAPVINKYIFAYDGVISHDSILGQISYVNFYCNGIMKFNEDVDEIKRQKTVDTMFVPKVSIAHLATAVTNNSAPTLINRTSSLHNGILYLQSALKADNEKPGVFVNSSVIDMYSDNYLGSFYLPVPMTEVRQFVMMDQGGVAVLTKKKEVQIFIVK